MTDYCTPPFSVSGTDLFDTPPNRDGLQLVAENKGLQARGLGKYFGQKRVVRNVSLGIRRGEAVGLLGPNGAGKTTTFYMLTALFRAMRVRFI